MSSFVAYSEPTKETHSIAQDDNLLKVKHNSFSSSCSDRSSTSRHSSISSEIYDLIDGEKKSFKKDSKRKVKVPWNVLENEGMPRDLITFTYFSINALRHVFNLLDSKGNGMVAKTRLQVICATVCMVYDLNHNADELASFNGEKTELTFDELIKYLTSVLTRAENKEVDMVKVELTAWAIISKEGKESGSEMFTDDALFKLWQIFNKLICDDTVSIHVEEVSLLLENYMKAIGSEWDSQPLYDFTKKSQLTFWEFINCLETEYLHETPVSVYMEGLETLSEKYIQEIIKVGWLSKKGHRVKSIKERWFVFTPHLMSYYETARLAKKKGEIVINTSAKVDNVPDSKNFKCRFCITCGLTEKLYEIEARDQRTKNEWISVIKQCIGIDDDVTPLMVELSERVDKRKEKHKRESQVELQRLQQQEFLNSQLKELENTRLALDQANIQTETEAALKDEERKRRVEMEVLKAEYERLLDEERQAREEENLARVRQEEMLADETSKRLELERIKSEQDEILAVERKMREGLEELSKEQTKMLEEERKRLNLLEEAQRAAEAELASAREKLEASERESRAAASRVEQAKERTRLMTGASGLNKTIPLSQQRPITHRGAGAFSEGDFSKTPLYLLPEEERIVVNQSEVPNENERAQIVETNLVKPSEGRDTFEKNLNGSNT